jgi:ATP-dependent DNA ligase
MNTLQTIIPRPRYGTCDLKSALGFDWRGWHISRKIDGCWRQREIADSLIIGEAMRDGHFFAFDCPVAYGEDVRRRSWTERREALLEIARTFPAGMSIAPEGHGAEFIEAVLRDGGEGVVAKPFAAHFGFDWVKVKRVETHDCTVIEIHPFKHSVHLSENGIDRGWCPCPGKSFDLVKAGDVVEVTAYGRHASGKFREARFVRVRYDKAVL